MKKLITSTIVLLPLLLLAIMLVSGAIVANMVHIYVESVEFVGNGALVLTMEDEQTPPSEQLEVNVLPLKAENRDLTYSVEDESIATVDENGVITAKDFGETYVTVASVENVAATAKRKVLVTDDAVHRISLNKDNTDLYEGTPQELSVTFFPKEAKNRSITWTSSDESILRISINGTATVVGAGTVIVTAVSDDNEEATDSATFTCHRKLTDIVFDQAQVVTSSREQKFPAMELKPADVDVDVKIGYQSSDLSIATVDDDGSIHFLKEGKVAITVTATDFGGTSISKSKEYTSTDGYYLPPLFEKKEYTVDFDEYFQNGAAVKTLPIPFATVLEGSYQEFKEVEYHYDDKNGPDADVLTFDEDTKKFSFAKEMPAGRQKIRVEVTARVYRLNEGIVDYQDYFTLTVLRNAQSISLSYGDMSDVSVITTDLSQITLGGGLSVSPANHTNDITYRLKEASAIAEIQGSKIKFSGAGEVTVVIELSAKEKQADGNVVSVVKLSKEVRVAYAPKPDDKSNVKATEFENGETEQQLLLKADKNNTDTFQESILYFNEPTDAEVSYAVEEGADAAVKIEERNGFRYIVPQKGGFATVTITVTPKAAVSLARRARNAVAPIADDGTKVYTVRVYVDRPVTSDNFKVKFEESNCTNSFGTTLSSVSYTVTVECEDGAMEGKKLYVKYGDTTDATAAESALTQSGSIPFAAEKDTLEVTFGVEYGEDAIELGATGGLSSAKRTITRNAENIAVSYNGNADVVKISTWQTSLAFVTEKTAQDEKEKTVYLNITPENHTNTVVYTITEGEEYADINGNGQLFIKQEHRNAACSVKVKISLLAKDSTPVESPSREVVVSYAPENANRSVKIANGTTTGYNLLLKYTANAKEEGVLYFTEPADATVTYAPQGDDAAVKLENRNGAWYVVPQKGGFADVTVTVTPKAKAEATTYTVRVYVDRPVTSDNFKVKFEGSDCTNSFGTTLSSVSYTVTVECEDGAMEGKKLYVKYGNTTDATAAESALTQSGNILFNSDLSTLEVTFGVEYGEDATKLGANGGLASTTRTITRNAENIAVSYNGNADVVKISTWQTSLAFVTEKTEQDEKEKTVYLNITPENHTNTVVYTITEGGEYAEINGNGQLFIKQEHRNTACSVKVKISLLAKDDTPVESPSREIVVAYAPENANRSVKIANGTTTGYNLLLKYTANAKEEGVLYFTEPADATVTYAPQGADAAVKLAERNGAWYVVPQKGGFADVTVTVTPKAKAEATTYTVRVYVDRPVTSDGIVVKFNGSNDPCTNYFSTALKAVPYTVTVECEDGAMEGKRIFVTADGNEKATGEDGATSFTDKNISFDETKNILEVTFGVEYDEEATKLGANGGLASTTRTIARNATSVAISHKGSDAAKISTWQSALTFITGTAESEETVVNLTILPANHTNTVVYTITEGDQFADFTPNGNNGGKLAIKNKDEACNVKVKISLLAKDGTTLSKLDKVIEIAYAPRSAEDKDVELSDTQTEQTLLLRMGSGKNDKGIIRFTEPGDAKVTYAVTKGTAVEVKDESGTHQIIPVTGGFATVTVTVTPNAGGEVKTYTAEVYVDNILPADAIAFTFDGEVDTKGTTAESVEFTVTVNGENGAMEGKRIIVTATNAQSKKGSNNVTSLTDSFSFSKELDALEVTFATEYTEEAAKFSASGGLGNRKTATVGRNAENVTFTYGGVQTVNIMTDKASFTIGTDIVVAISPAHTDTISYSVEGDAAELKGSTLTFSKPGSVTLVGKMMRGETPTGLTKELTISYAPTDSNQSVKLAEKETHYLVLGTDQEGLIYYTLPENSKFEPSFEKNNSVINVVEENGILHIKPIDGGFATVTFTTDKTYTIYVYVDRTVDANDIKIEFNNEEDVKGTTAESVTFTVKVNGGNDESGAMEGKRVYAQVNGKKEYGADDAASHAFTFEFPKTSSKLVITYGVEYTEKAKKADTFNANGNLPNGKSTTIERNAENVTFTYGGVQTVNIMTSDKTFTIGGNLSVKISPDENQHTDKISYRVEGDAAELKGSTLTFSKPGSVTLVGKMMRGETPTGLTKELTISYEPAGTKNKSVNLAEKETHYLVLNTSQEALIYYTVPVNYELTPSFEKNNSVINVVEANGILHIKPIDGGFATVTFTTDKTYTIHVYVDRTVDASDIEIKFNNEVDTKGTTAESVTFTVSATKAGAGALKGKKVYVKVDDMDKKEYGTANAEGTTFTFEFPKTSSTLTIEYHLEYDGELLQSYGLSGEQLSLEIPSTKVGRNAETITVAFGGAQEIEHLVTSEQYVTFLLEKPADSASITTGAIAIVTIGPDNHTDKGMKYTLAKDAAPNSITEAGKLTFNSKEPVTVTVKISVMRGEVATLTKSITVTYIPKANASEDKNQSVELGTQMEGGKLKENFDVVLTTEKGSTSSPENPNEIPDTPLYVNASMGSTITTEVTKGGEEGNKVVELVSVKDADGQPIPGAYTIHAVKGGFATITITVSGAAPVSLARRARSAVRTIAENGTTYTIQVYVDKPVSKDDFEITFTTKHAVTSLGYVILEHAPAGEDIFHTCYDQVRYSVTVKDVEGSLVGKKLYVKFDNATIATAAEGMYTISPDSDVKLEGENYHQFTFGVEYTDQAKAFVGEGNNGINSVDRKVLSSNKKLLSKPTILYHSGTPNDKMSESEMFTLSPDPNTPTEIIFNGIGSNFAFGVYGVKYKERSGAFDPIDFQDLYSSMSLSSNVTLTSSGAVTKYAANGALYTPLQIQLQAKAYCIDEIMQLDIFGQVFYLKVSVVALAETMSIKAGPKSEELSDGITYKTIIDQLNFQIDIGRKNDTTDITDKNIEWSYDNSHWNSIGNISTHAEVTIDLSVSPSNSLFFRTAYSGVSRVILIDYVEPSQAELRYTLFVSVPDESDPSGQKTKRKVFGTIESNQIGTGQELAFTVPADMVNGAITFQLELSKESAKYLDGFGTDKVFMDRTQESKVLTANDQELSNWSVGFDSTWGQIIFKTEKSNNFKTMKCVVDYASQSVTVSFSYNQQNIELIGFDSGNKTTDVYKGYQQVRVFAKHSDYGTGKTSQIVDYFKVPYKAEGTVTQWSLTPYNGSEEDTTLAKTTQDGYNVTVTNGEVITKYMIKIISEGNYGLYTVDESGSATDTLAPATVMWVDAYSEPGYARIHFGDFVGLSESDVQNDLFGNFDEAGTWTKPENVVNSAGKSVTASAGAFKFLRFAASTDGSGPHFNLNVLQDPANVQLVNVFNATGYYASRNVVLHANLYGPEELEEGALAEIAEENDQVLNRAVSNQNDSAVTKDLIFGNGYQVNLKILCDAVKDSDLDSGKENMGHATYLGTLYNVVLKGNNPHNDIKGIKDRLFFVIKNAYYSDIQYYTKMNVASGGTIKNTVLRYVASAAVQLWNAEGTDPPTVYLENVVIAECLKGLTLENAALSNENGEADQKFYFKGFFDVLNYYSLTGLGKAMANLGGAGTSAAAMLTGELVPQQYAEWFGKSTNYDGYAIKDDKYLNIAVYSSRIGVYVGSSPLNYWDESTNGFTITNPEEANYKLGIALAAGERYACVTGWTYKTGIDVDGGKKVESEGKTYYDRDMSKLFAAGDEIRLLCQYLDSDNASGEPIKNTDHILWHLQKCYRNPELIQGRTTDHMEALKQSLENAEKHGWDGVWPDGTTPSDAETAAAALTAMVSETVLPSKRDFA